jgi:hypothetical protein
MISTQRLVLLVLTAGGVQRGEIPFFRVNALAEESVPVFVGALRQEAGLRII